MKKYSSGISKSIQEMEDKYIAQINELLAQNGILKLMLSKDPIDPLLIKRSGIPNVVFGYAGSIRDGEDEREPIWKAQRLERGFDDTELWGLDTTIAQFILPRLKRLIEIGPQFSAPNLTPEYDVLIRDFLFAMEAIATDASMPDSPEGERFKKGLDAFPEIIRSLWF